MEGEPQAEKMTIEKALSEIEIVWQQISQFGGVSNEHDLIENIKKQLIDKEIIPEDAIMKVHQIMHSKNGFDTHYR